MIAGENGLFVSDGGSAKFQSIDIRAISYDPAGKYGLPALRVGHQIKGDQWELFRLPFTSMAATTNDMAPLMEL